MENNNVNVNEQRPWFFNLIKDGDEAVVRILHSNPLTIESADTHRIEVAGKKKRVRCTGDGCPLCANGNQKDHRIYIHLYDYTDNKEKVWDRTDKILPQLNALFESWNPLNSAVIKIKRKGNEFPQYDLIVQNPTGYADVDKSLINKPEAFRYSLKRTNDEIKTFMETGAFPERKAFIPKEEYFKSKQEQEVQETSVNNELNNSTPIEDQSEDSNTFDPFADSIITKPKKVF